MQRARGQCSNRRRVSNKCRVSIKRRGFEVRVLIRLYTITYSATADASRSSMPLCCSMSRWTTPEAPSPHYTLKPTFYPENITEC